MRKLHERIFVRQRHNWILLSRFAVVGATGVLVNFAVLVLCNKLGPPHAQSIAPIPGTRFSIRWYHAYSTIAFLVANFWNFLLNRWWTFRSTAHSQWWREYGPFLAVGMMGQVVGLVLLTMLMHPDSPLHLPASIFDDTTGLRTRLYWGQLIVIAVTTPLTFALNKIWTFAAVRGHQPTSLRRPR